VHRGDTVQNHVKDISLLPARPLLDSRAFRFRWYGGSRRLPLYDEDWTTFVRIGFIAIGVPRIAINRVADILAVSVRRGFISALPDAGLGSHTHEDQEPVGSSIQSVIVVWP
jgi:hypothetical protein